MQTILVTGSTGFVGRNLVPYLQELKATVIPLSLRGDWKVKLPDNSEAIIHLAGKAHDTSNTSVPDEYFRINTELTRTLFDLFLAGTARDFIYFSSVKAAADTVDGILTEEVIPAPQTPYGQSKQQAEAYLLSKALPAGKRLFIIRPCMIHGPGNKGNLNLLYRFVAKGIPYPLAAFENKRSFLGIDNLCYAIAGLLNNKEIPSGIYNLADDEALSTNELVRIIAGVLRKKPRLLALPQGLLNGAARLGDRLKLPLNSERLKKLTENYIVDNSKIKKALGITAFPVPAAEGLSRTIESFDLK